MNKDKEGKIGYRDIFRQREYMKVIVAALINRLGDSLDAIAFTWIVYEITENAAWSAFVYAANLLPTIFVTPFAGVWVERKPKKPIMVITDLARAACVTFVATGYLMGFLRPWMLLANSMIISTAEAFRGPANTTLTPLILGKKYYEYGMSLMSAMTNAVQIVGMAIAAGVISVIGSAGALYADVATFVLSALILSTVKAREKKPGRQGTGALEKGRFWADLAFGARYLSQKKILLYFLAVAIFMNALATPLNSLEAPLANEILRSGVETLSIIGIMLTAGAMLGNFLYPMARKRMRGKILLFVSDAYLGVYYLALVAGMPLYGNRIFLYPYIAALSLVVGIAVSFGNSLVSVELVKQTEESYLARVSAIYTALNSAASPIVALVISGIVMLWNTRVVFLGAGVLAILGSATMLFAKILDTLDEPGP